MTSRTILLVSGLALTAALPKPPMVLPQNLHDPPALPAGTHASVGVCPGCGPNVTSAACALIHGCCKCCAKPNPCKPQQVLGSTADVGTGRDGVATTAKALAPRRMSAQRGMVWPQQPRHPIQVLHVSSSTARSSSQSARSRRVGTAERRSAARGSVANSRTTRRRVARTSAR